MSEAASPLRPEILAALPALCREFHVERLDAFGSAVTGRFDPARSDVDMLVRYDTAGDRDSFRDYLKLKDEPEALFQRPVDLIVESAIKNPYLRRQVEAERKPLLNRP